MNCADERLQDFVRLFNSKHFFEAHEVLEGLWLDSEGEAKEFYRGLVQCAVAFAHLQRGNLSGAKRLHARSAGYLTRYPSQYLGINTSRLMEEVDAFFANLGSESDLDWKKAPVILWSEA